MKQSSVLFKISCFLNWVAILLDCVCFSSHYWIVDTDFDWNYGLWKLCSSDLRNVSQDHGDIQCQPIGQQGIWAPNMSSDTSSDMLPPMGFQAVQTSEVFGFICLAISVVIISTLLCCVSNPRLVKKTVFTCALASTCIFIGIGVGIIFWIFGLYVHYFGYSFWLAIVASILCYLISILLRLDTAKEDTIRGNTNKRGLVLEVCGCRSSLNDSTTPQDSPSYPDPQEPFYSVWRKKPHKQTHDHRPRLYSEVLRNFRYFKAPTEVYKPASEGQLLTGVSIKVPTIRVSQSPQRRMSCPEKRHFATSGASIL